MAAGLLVLLLAFELDAVESARHLVAERSRTQDRLSVRRARLEAELNARLALVHGLSAVVKTHQGLALHEFAMLARELLTDQSGVLSVQLAPGGVVSQVYPFERNKAALGLDLLNTPSQSEAALRAIHNHELVVAGPMPLTQGGTGIVARLPVFLTEDGAADEHFWGFVTVILDLPPLLAGSHLFDDEDDLTYAIRGKDGLGARSAVFYGEPTLFDADPVILDITLPYGSWQIAATPVGGWPSGSPKRPFLFGLASMLALVVGGLVWRVSSQAISLRQAIGVAQENETKFRAIFDRSSELCGLMTPEGIMTEVNRTALESIRATPDDIIGQPFWECPWWNHSAELQSLLRRNIAVAASGKLARFEATHPTADGHWMTVDVSISPLFDAAGQVRMLMPEGHDITQRKAVEEAVREREELYRQMFQSNAAVKLIIDPADGAIIDANEAAATFYGYSRRQLCRLNIHDIDVAPKAELDTSMGQAASEQRCYFRFHHRLAGGDQREVEVFSGPVRRGNKTLLHSIIHDVTERSQLEKALADSNRELELFAYAASHDLREPLRMVTSYLQLLERRVGAGLGQEGQEFLAFAVEGARRMDRLIVDLLEFSRVGRHNRPFALTPLDDVVRTTLSNLGPAIKDSAAVVVLPEDGLPSVMGDEGELARLFQNLIGNAVKYHPANRAPVVRIAAERRDGEWLITVADNGIGIEPAYFERIFQLFQRLHPRGEYDGTGIGLPLVKKIAERHGGRVWVESIPEVGSTFGVALPALAEAVAD